MHKLINGAPTHTRYAWILSDGCTGTSGWDSALRAAAIGTLCIAPASARWGPGRAAFMQERSSYVSGGDPALDSVYAAFAYDAILAAATAVAIANPSTPFVINSTTCCLANSTAEARPSWAEGTAVMNALSGLSFVGATSGSGTVTVREYEVSQCITFALLSHACSVRKCSWGGHVSESIT